MKCSKCGNEIANDSVFCEFCGTKVENSKTILVRQNKQVDIRWCLLPAMLIISIAVGFVYYNYSYNYSYDYCCDDCYDRIKTDFINYANILRNISPFLDCFFPFLMIISTLLFLITLWYAIKKRIRLSFILIMGIMCLSHWYLLNSAYGDLHFDEFLIIFFTCLFFSLLYIIYEIIANKRNWRF